MTVKKFADDTKIANVILDAQSQLNLQQALNNLCNWADVWGMQFNVKKCHVLHVGRKNQQASYYMQGTELVKVDEEKDIGVGNYC